MSEREENEDSKKIHITCVICLMKSVPRLTSERGTRVKKARKKWVKHEREMLVRNLDPTQNYVLYV